MFFNIHLVSYFIDEDAGMFLLRCNAVLILSKKKERKTSCLLLLTSCKNLQHQFQCRNREVVLAHRSYWWKIKENVYVMRFCRYWMWSDGITRRDPTACGPDQWFLRLLLAVFWRSSVCHGPVLMTAASIPHMTDECCPLPLCVSHGGALT